MTKMSSCCYLTIISLKKWTGDILLEYLKEGRSLILIKKIAEKHGCIASCLSAMHYLTGSDTVPKIFDTVKVPA